MARFNTIEEAREAIKQEFMEGFYEWLKDEREMSEDDYGRKYGYGKGTTVHEDNWESVKVYREYFFGGRYLPAWERAGYSREAIWQLKQDGFLSYKEYSNWNARARGKTDWFFISLKTARQIYKECKLKAA